MKITSRYIDIPGVVINNNKIPENLRGLLPLAKKWAIGDDAERENFIKKATIEEKKHFVEKILPKIDEINEWCDKLRALTPVPDEGVLFDDMMEAWRDVEYIISHQQ